MLCLVHLQRVLEYSNHIQQEAAHDIAETKPPASWPQTGRIKFENVVMSYRPGLPPALKNLSLDVGTNEKVGIVGRTGEFLTSSEGGKSD
jgi:ABC-type multidrug transport system fused ATPase/permease subunit